MIYNRYGIRIGVDDIKMQYVENRNIATREEHPEVVEYKICYEDDGEAYSFTGTYFPKEKSEVVFDLESYLIEEYAQEYLECDFYPNWNIFNIEVFLIKTQIVDTEEKEQFVERFRVMLDALFSDSRMENSNHSFIVGIAIDNIMDTVILSLDKNNYMEKCSTLSDELEPILQETIIRKLYEEGEYTREEYVKKIWELEAQKQQ